MPRLFSMAGGGVRHQHGEHLRAMRALGELSTAWAGAGRTRSATNGMAAICSEARAAAMACFAACARLLSVCAWLGALLCD